MINHRNKSSGIINASNRFIAISLILFVIIASAFTGSLIASAVQGENTDPLRTLHKVKVADKSYCFFVEKNVVLTPADIAADENGKELTDE